MRFEFVRDTRAGIFDGVHEREKFVEDRDAGSATVVGREDVECHRYVRGVPDVEEYDAETAARVCPVDAATVPFRDDRFPQGFRPG